MVYLGWVRRLERPARMLLEWFLRFTKADPMTFKSFDEVWLRCILEIDCIAQF